MSSNYSQNVVETFRETSQILFENLGTVVLIIGAWFAVHTIFVLAIRTTRSLGRQAFFTRALAGSLIGYALSDILAKIIFADEIHARSLGVFLSLFMAWQIYLTYVGVQRTNRIGISKWWNLLISIPATNNILYLLVIFFWRDRQPADGVDLQRSEVSDPPASEATLAHLPERYPQADETISR